MTGIPTTWTLCISIHALREEGDSTTPSASTTSKISIHALREEGDVVNVFTELPIFDFYPRPPRGGRPTRISSAPKRFIFLSTPSARRATHREAVGIQLDQIFLSTPSARRAT